MRACVCDCCPLLLTYHEGHYSHVGRYSHVGHYSHEGRCSHEGRYSHEGRHSHEGHSPVECKHEGHCMLGYRLR